MKLTACSEQLRGLRSGLVSRTGIDRISSGYTLVELWVDKLAREVAAIDDELTFLVRYQKYGFWD